MGKLGIVAITLLTIVGGLGLVYTSVGTPMAANTWQQLVNPGELSVVHASLEQNCAACHTAVMGVDATKCILCHANEESLLQRQPTAFHADVRECRSCHHEHRGHVRKPSNMDHRALAKIGLLNLPSDENSFGEAEMVRWNLTNWLEHSEVLLPSPLANHHVAPEEAILNCATCHKNDDRHFELFGQDCAACHATQAWTLPEFQHPPGNSMDCVHCHQAPPSHYMKHFTMISQRVAGQPQARVDQCFLCHQTTSWPDIKRAGMYKHH
ncbi:cytochrome c3 family protein [Candidatus Nitronereus thalassa]|uniref:Cytochrome c3 family protein n=1 Tax=Candidatus Nitronereus thalassa TaxID=3020898 RepID=A0ABU3K2Y2_9BACT|nr:cytochrome c3 family protein [Candidatus Nitronereus thalassa]MDT7040748.1 cytochrome c3 family protein [Candidatus Nitronereus thalassa]